MTEYLKFMGQFLGGIALFIIGTLILIRQIKISKKEKRLCDKYGNEIEIYFGAIVLIMIGLVIFLRAL
jgi:hypothetical protein